MKVDSFIFIFLCFARNLCCDSSINTEQKIINGLYTNIRSVPYMLSLRIRGTHMCGAAIINKKWAVTAAHCIKGAKDPVKDITLCSGSSSLFHCTNHNVAKFFIHERYYIEINDYDIAVIQVTPVFTYNDCTKPVNLAKGYVIRSEWGKICGWGYFQKNSNDIVPRLSKNLQCTTVPRVKKNRCEEYYENMLTPMMICYGFQEGGRDTCQGDSGGPIVNSDNTLLGITSWGYGCGEKYAPGVYTNAVLLQSWIRDKTKIDTVKKCDSKCELITFISSMQKHFLHYYFY